MADTAGRIFCKTCGKEITEQTAKRYNIGRKIQYQCYECYKTGESEANSHIAITVNKFRKEQGE